MRRNFIPAVVAFFALTCASSLWAQKIEVDPNTPSAATEQKVDDSTVDERLAQKVTYTATGKRLHTVLEELSTQTGVTVRCGKNDDDWQVRDLPVIVCARDIKLGKLLRAIKDCTHLGFSAFSVDGVKSYRMWQDAACQKMLDDYRDEMRKAKIAAAECYWKTWQEFGNKPDCEISISPADFWKYNHFCSYEDGRAMAKILVAIPESIKQQAFSTGRTRYVVRDLPDGLVQTIVSQFRWCYEYKQKQANEYCTKHGTDAPSDDGFDAEAILDSILCIDVPLDREQTWFRVSLAGKYGNRESTIRGAMFSRNPEGMWLDYPMPPSGPVGDVQTWMDECGTGEFPDLWSQKTKLDELAARENFSRADRLVALADASGFTFVSEDYECIRESFSWQETLALLAKELDSVEAIHRVASTGAQRWFACRKEKVCVGFDWNWVDNRGHVIPADLLDTVRAKLNGPGLVLDDAASAAARLTAQQMSAVYCTGGSDLTSILSLQADPLWRFYGKLSSEDKKAAKSEAGIPLAEFDPTYVRSCFVDALVASSPTSYSYGRMSPFAALPTDADLLCKLSLRIRATEVRPTIMLPVDKEGRMSRSQSWPDGVMKNTYSIELIGEDYYLLLEKPYPQFPIYSRARELELWKQMHEESGASDASAMVPVR